VAELVHYFLGVALAEEGYSDKVVREVLLFRVPPWPQPQAL